MRIVAGQYRGKKLYSPEGKNVRPTSERAREAVFNILNSRYENGCADFKVADIFAGTGAFGFEALSRGAAGVTFVDTDTKLVQKNTGLFLKEREKIRLIRADARSLPFAPEKFDIVYLDAPYAQNLTVPVLQQLTAKNWLKENSLCIAEIRYDEQFSLPDGFSLIDERTYGLARVLFLQLS